MYRSVNLLRSEIDECDIGTDSCFPAGGSFCVNTDGSYECTCPPGTVLQPDGITCIGKTKSCHIILWFARFFHKIQLCYLVTYNLAQFDCIKSNICFGEPVHTNL